MDGRAPASMTSSVRETLPSVQAPATPARMTAAVARAAKTLPFPRGLARSGSGAMVRSARRRWDSDDRLRAAGSGSRSTPAKARRKVSL